MGDWAAIAKLIEGVGTAGLAGLLLFIFWRLADKHADRFLQAQEKQATAMAEMAGAVREALVDLQTAGESQRETLLAVRVLTTKQEETKEWIKELLNRRSPSD